MLTLVAFDHSIPHQAPFEHSTHHQAAFEHGMHQQAAFERGMHQQAAFEHGMHQQAAFERGMHQQAGQIHGSHLLRRIKIYTKQAKASKNGSRSSSLTTAAGAGAVALVVVVAVILIFAHFHSSPPPGPGGTPQLALQGKAIPGQSITLKGSSFRPSKAAVMLDDQPLGSGGHNQQSTEAPLADVMGALPFLTSQAPAAGGWITVNSDGTFAVDVPISEL